LATIKIAENLELGGNRKIKCSRCNHEFCTLSENWKRYATQRPKGSVVEEGLINLHGDLAIFEYVCPNCGVLLDVEIARKDEPPLWDTQLSPDSPSEKRD